MPRQSQDDIPAALAASLHALGLTWAAIGRSIASQRGRPVPFQGESVASAVWRARKAGLLAGKK